MQAILEAIQAGASGEEIGNLQVLPGRVRQA